MVLKPRSLLEGGMTCPLLKNQKDVQGSCLCLLQGTILEFTQNGGKPQKTFEQMASQLRYVYP